MLMELAVSLLSLVGTAYCMLLAFCLLLRAYRLSFIS